MRPGKTVQLLKAKAQNQKKKSGKERGHGEDSWTGSPGCLSYV